MAADDAETTPMSDEAVLPLLVAMLGDDVQPFELLAARAAQRAGREWAGAILGEAPASPLPLDAWLAMKNQAKRSFSRHGLAQGDDEALGAFLKYLAAIAGARRDHGASITEMSAEEVGRALGLVGPYLPEPWRACFARARAVIDPLDDQVV